VTARRRWVLAAALAALSPLRSAGGQVAIFRSDSVLAVTIRTDLRALLRDRDTLNAQWHEGSFTLMTGAAPVTVPVRLRTRGVFRRRTCDFPPIRLRFAGKDVRGTPLEGLSRPKLATHCFDRDQYEQNLLQEYAIYRVLRLFTPASLTVRLLRVTWEDTPGARRPLTRYGFLIEEEEQLAQRLGGALIASVGIRFANLAPADAALVGMFQYFIANTDWSLPFRHNIALVRTGAGLRPVMYDFDWSGVIDAPYAQPDRRLRITSVRQRVFRGACQGAAELEPVLARFEALRDSIAAVYRAVPGLDPRVLERTLRYHEEFFRAIADRPRFVSQVIERECPR
jgi:hypothetical protein